jgi:hypothetical protein
MQNRTVTFRLRLTPSERAVLDAAAAAAGMTASAWARCCLGLQEVPIPTPQPRPTQRRGEDDYSEGTAPGQGADTV